MNAVSNDSALTRRELRDMFALFPTGVAIVTARGLNDDLIASTVSSFSSVSLEPPLVLFSMARASKSFEGWQAAHSFAVNILAEDQRSLSARFASSADDKWSGISSIVCETSGLPLLDGALGFFHCRTWARYDGGDHLIIVGEVIRAARLSTKKPLIFAASRYARLADDVPVTAL